MILVLFEVTINKEHMDGYLALAAKLKDDLVNSEGFVRSERFSSLVNEGKLLSLSVWENEEAVSAWRNQQQHRMAQRQGRDSLFESYTITVAAQTRCYNSVQREGAPADSNHFFSCSV